MAEGQVTAAASAAAAAAAVAADTAGQTLVAGGAGCRLPGRRRTAGRKPSAVAVAAVIETVSRRAAAVVHQVRNIEVPLRNTPHLVDDETWVVVLVGCESEETSLR